MKVTPLCNLHSLDSLVTMLLPVRRACLQVSVREYYRDGEEFLPAKKGIALNREQWEALRSATKRIDRAVDKLS